MRNDDNVDLTLIELSRTLWGGRRLLTAVTIVAACISVVVAKSIPNVYTSSAVIAPIENAQTMPSGQFASLARIAGIGGGGSGASDTDIAIATLSSESFLVDFARRHGLANALVSERIADNGAFTVSQGQSNVKSDPDNDEVETRALVFENFQIYEALSAKIQVSKDQLTGFITVSVSDTSPYEAKMLVGLLIRDVDDLMRARTVAQANEARNFLLEQVEKTPLSDVRAMIYELIQGQVEKIMLATTRPNYIFNVVDAATVPYLRSAPNRVLIVALGLVLGIFSGALLVLLLHWVRQSKY